MEDKEIGKSKDKPNIYKIDFYKMFWIFFIGSFAGVIIETIWCYISFNKIESRSGLIYGPFNLVYGFGALFITLGLRWLLKKHFILVFIGGAAIGSVFEYFCSLIQEVMFGTVSWQYYHIPFNLGGRITLRFAIFWGVLSVVWISFLCPLILKLIDKINKEAYKPLTWILLGFMIFNTIISAIAVDRMSKRRNNIMPSTSIEVFLDNTYPDQFLKEVYPNMMYVK